MDPVLLVGFAICFLLGSALSSVLIYIDVDGHLKSKGSLGHDYRWERALSILFGVVQMVASIAGGVLAVSALRSGGRECVWLEMDMVSNVQLLAGVNLAHILQHLQWPNWVVRLAYATVLAVVLLWAGLLHYVDEKPPAFALSLLPCAIASGLSTVLSYLRLRDNKTAGTSGGSSGYRQLLKRLIAANAISASALLCGAMLLVAAFFAGWSMGGNLRGGAVLACTVLQLLCCFALCLGSFRRWFRRKARQPNEAGLEDGRSGNKSGLTSPGSTSTIIVLEWVG